jgi:hypothetical protein
MGESLYEKESREADAILAKERKSKPGNRNSAAVRAQRKPNR